MIVTRTPLRITLGGGGSDVPWYSNTSGGYCIAAAINKYVYVAVNENFNEELLLRYSEVERVPLDDRHQIRHRLLRALLQQWYLPIELSVMADAPAGTGLGSSSSFTVGVVNALTTFQHLGWSTQQIADQAVRIELDVLNDPIGKQDQYIAAFGGLREMTFQQDGTVKTHVLALSRDTRRTLDEHLLLFYTGHSRSASDVLASNAAPDLDAVKALGWNASTALTTGDLESFGHLMTLQWMLKLEAAPSPQHRQANEWLRRGMRHGAIGGKLVGAGNGGFLLFLANDNAALRAELGELRELPFHFDDGGSAVVAR